MLVRIRYAETGETVARSLWFVRAAERLGVPVKWLWARLEEGGGYCEFDGYAVEEIG